jgi:hypothetical protein
MKYFTQIREQEDGAFVVVAGENPDGMSGVGRELSLAAALRYRTWWVQSMGMQKAHMNHGFVSLVPMQGKIASH